MFNKIKKLLLDLASIIAVIIIVISILCLVSGVRPDVVLSGSMEPEMGTGSLAFTNTKDKDIEVGDIIYFKSGTASVAHRVVEITEEGYITKGDNNENRDFKIVTKDMVVGTVFFWIPKLGYFVKWIVSLPGLIVIATIIICMFLLSKLFEKKDDENASSIDDEVVNETS